jgi:hypothetical protein
MRTPTPNRAASPKPVETRPVTNCGNNRRIESQSPARSPCSAGVGDRHRAIPQVGAPRVCGLRQQRPLRAGRRAGPLPRCPYCLLWLSGRCACLILVKDVPPMALETRLRSGGRQHPRSDVRTSYTLPMATTNPKLLIRADGVARHEPDPPRRAHTPMINSSDTARKVKATHLHPSSPAIRLPGSGPDGPEPRPGASSSSRGNLVRRSRGDRDPSPAAANRQSDAVGSFR